jgi:hypothetical protein
LSEGGDIYVVEGLFGVEILLGDELVVVQLLGAAEVQLLLFEVCPGLVDCGGGGLFRGDVRVDIGFGASDGGLLGGDGGFGLHIFDGGNDGAGLYVVAFFDVEVRDAAKAGGPDVDVGLRLDLAGSLLRLEMTVPAMMPPTTKSTSTTISTVFLLIVTFSSGADRNGRAHLFVR